MNDVLKKFLSDKSVINPITQEPLSKEKRIESMYNFVQNRIYDRNYSIQDKILASKLITQILEEEL